jgi:hypothetical protein
MLGGLPPQRAEPSYLWYDFLHLSLSLARRHHHRPLVHLHIHPVALPPESTTETTGTIPTSQPKRKQNFELIIEIPAKRFKASRYQTATASSSSNNSAASSSGNPSGVNGVEAPHPQPRKGQTHTASKSRIRQIAATTFKVTLKPELRDVTVTRKYLGAKFGASGYSAFTEIPRRLADRHGYDHFIFVHDVRPNPKGMSPTHPHAELKQPAQESSPQAPSAPGEPGMIACFQERPWPVLEHYRVFVRVSRSPSRWQYMGLYKATRLPAWTPNEVKRQRIRVHLSLPTRTSLFEVITERFPLLGQEKFGINGQGVEVGASDPCPDNAAKGIRTPTYGRRG